MRNTAGVYVGVDRGMLKNGGKGGLQLKLVQQTYYNALHPISARWAYTNFMMDEVNIRVKSQVISIEL